MAVAIDLGNVNWVAVLMAGLMAWAIGGLWYSPPVFGKRWIELLDVKTEDGLPEGAAKALVGGLFLAIFTAFFLALALDAFGATTLIDGALVGLLVWLGFVLTHGISNVMFEKQPLELLGITQTELAISFVAMGVILATWV